MTDHASIPVEMTLPKEWVEIERRKIYKEYHPYMCDMPRVKGMKKFIIDYYVRRIDRAHFKKFSAKKICEEYIYTHFSKKVLQLLYKHDLPINKFGVTDLFKIYEKTKTLPPNAWAKAGVNGLWIHESSYATVLDIVFNEDIKVSRTMLRK